MGVGWGAGIEMKKWVRLGGGEGGRLDLVSFNRTSFSKIVGQKSDSNQAPHRGRCRSAGFRQREPHFLVHPLRCTPDGQLSFAHNIIPTGDVAVHNAYTKNGTTTDIRHFE